MFKISQLLEAQRHIKLAYAQYLLRSADLGACGGWEPGAITQQPCDLEQTPEPGGDSGFPLRRGVNNPALQSCDGETL